MNRPALAAVLLALSATAAPAASAPHNVVIFVADGLRYSSVTAQIAPTLYQVKSDGVDFTNSHAMYPTLTTANASAIATGHYLGDTGDYANVLYAGFPVKAKQNSNVVFLEDDAILQEMKAHYADGYIGPTPLLCAAAAAGYSAAAIGKLGPAAIQELNCLGGSNPILIDDATGHPANPEGTPTGAVALPPDIAKQILAATGAAAPPPVSIPNRTQQAWFQKVVTDVLLPSFKSSGRPFVILFWSRDPDASQHAATDSLGKLVPGINGPTARAAITNADFNLAAIMQALKTLGLDTTTDVFVTADHGFSTISKGNPDDAGNAGPPSHPQGFLALEVADWLGQKLFDPDAANAELDPASGDHPARGNGLIGPTADAPEAIVAANGGSDFIYAPGPDARANAKTVFDHLLDDPAVGALFVNDDLLKTGDPKDFAGALPMSAIRLIGSANVPEPQIVVGFRSFDAKGCSLGEQLCAVEIADTSLGVGQGMHGSFSRADTRNFMAAIGPDFKAHFADKTPVGNGDIAPTLAHVLGLSIAPKGTLTGRIATEALVGGKPAKVTRGTEASLPAPNGLKTILNEQKVGPVTYFDAAGIPGRTVGLQTK